MYPAIAAKTDKMMVMLRVMMVMLRVVMVMLRVVMVMLRVVMVMQRVVAFYAVGSNGAGRQWMGHIENLFTGLLTT